MRDTRPCHQAAGGLDQIRFRSLCLVDRHHSFFIHPATETASAFKSRHINPKPNFKRSLSSAAISLQPEGGVGLQEIVGDELRIVPGGTPIGPPPAIY
jgi:hypothetical protein